MVTHSISPSMARIIHQVINASQPQTKTECRQLVENWLRKQSVHHCKLDVVVKDVRHYGYLQGVRVVLVDRLHRTRKQVTPKGKAYSIFE